MYSSPSIFIRPSSRDRPYYVIGYDGRAGGRPHRFPHNNFSSVFQIFTKLDHMIALWKGKNPIYFGVITIIKTGVFCDAHISCLLYISYKTTFFQKIILKLFLGRFLWNLLQDMQNSLNFICLSNSHFCLHGFCLLVI